MSGSGQPVHYGALDGWRAVSIVLVLCGHLLPLGPKRYEMNGAIAATGMVLFFILSGFLIASFLLRNPDAVKFLVRRFCRIVPLAWCFCAVVLFVEGASGPTWSAHLLFTANLPPFFLIEPTAHLWSLCLEMQFYVGVALIVALTGRRGLWLLPILCVAVTGIRIAVGAEVSIVTWLRIDEVLAGSTLALVFHRRPSPLDLPRSAALLVPLLSVLLVASAHGASGPFNYARPYIAAALVSTTLYMPGGTFTRFLNRRELAYLAKISFALYVFHGGLMSTWLSSGSVLVKYAKRPLFFAVLFALAHVSTFKFESWWIALGHRLTSRKTAAA